MSSRKQLAELKEREFLNRTRKNFSAEEKIRIVLDGLKGKTDIGELCQREGISTNLFLSWSKDFVDAGKKKLNGDIRNESVSLEIQNLKKENLDLKQLVAELTLEVRMLKKNLNGAL